MAFIRLNGNLDKYRRGFSIVSLVIGSVAAALPDPYAKFAFAVALGLSNAAIYIKHEQRGEKQRKD